jgi:small subunit ribosomal protein S17
MAEEKDKLEEVAAEAEATPKARKPRAKKAPAAKAVLTPEARHDARLAVRRKKAAERRTGRLHARAKAKASDHEPAVTPPREHVDGIQKTRQGVVVSDKANKTITVRIDTSRRHRQYAKVVRTSTTLHAHDETNDAHTGDTVVIREARPLSRLKRWRLVQVVERAK